MEHLYSRATNTSQTLEEPGEHCLQSAARMGEGTRSVQTVEGGQSKNWPPWGVSGACWGHFVARDRKIPFGVFT